MHDRGDTGARAGADVHGGARDRAGRRHAAEQGGRDVGSALAEQLSVGVVFRRVGHPVGDLGRQQALERGERSHRERGREEVARRADRQMRERRHRQRRRHRADRERRPDARSGRDRGDGDRDQRRGKRAMQPREHDHHGDDEQHEQQRGTVAVRDDCGRRPVRATTAVLSPFGLGTPSADGTCCRKMSVAIPTVKPSMTGHGTNAT